MNSSKQVAPKRRSSGGQYQKELLTLDGIQSSRLLVGVTSILEGAGEGVLAGDRGLVVGGLRHGILQLERGRNEKKGW